MNPSNLRWNFIPTKGTTILVLTPSQAYSPRLRFKMLDALEAPPSD